MKSAADNMVMNILRHEFKDASDEQLIQLAARSLGYRPPVPAAGREPRGTGLPIIVPVLERLKEGGL